jgi:UDP-N-acetylglucosamine 2-epimerase (non-hydrolysing)
MTRSGALARGIGVLADERPLDPPEPLRSRANRRIVLPVTPAQPALYRAYDARARPTILSIVGTRPEAIKLAPVIRALGRRPAVRSLVCATGQHTRMLDQALADFAITADFVLSVGRRGQGLGQLLGRALAALGPVLDAARPDAVVVQGDTTSALAGALVAAGRGIPVGHVEAGLRTSRPEYPFPEEMNRRAIGRLATWHFAPTQAARANLLAEAVRGVIFETGNPVVDGLALASARPAPPLALRILRRVGPRKLVLVTCHRRENWGHHLERVGGMLGEESARDPRICVVWPLHGNPAVRARVSSALAGRPGVILCPPMPHAVFVALLRHAAVVLTDSGGVLEEAVTLGRAAVVLRPEIERPEALGTGGVRLVGQDIARARLALRRWLERPPRLDPAAVFGDGRAGERIADALVKALWEA